MIRLLSFRELLITYNDSIFLHAVILKQCVVDDGKSALREGIMWDNMSTLVDTYSKSTKVDSNLGDNNHHNCEIVSMWMELCYGQYWFQVVNSKGMLREHKIGFICHWYIINFLMSYYKGVNVTFMLKCERWMNEIAWISLITEYS